MKSSEEIIDKLCLKVALSGSRGTWNEKDDRVKCLGWIDALKWVLKDSEEDIRKEKPCQ